MEYSIFEHIDIGHFTGKKSLKQSLLYYDKIYYSKDIAQAAMVRTYEDAVQGKINHNLALNSEGKLEILKSSKLFVELDFNDLQERASYVYENLSKISSDLSYYKNVDVWVEEYLHAYNLIGLPDVNDHLLEIAINGMNTLVSIALENSGMSIALSAIPRANNSDCKSAQILNVVHDKFPVLDDSVPIEQIIEYKADEEARLKFLRLRNWMIDMSKGDYTLSEVNEKMEHLLHEYKHAVSRHKMKVNEGTVKSFLISTAEFMEDLVRMKFSKAIKAGFAFAERKTKLLDLPNNIPGKEVAFVHDVNEKFGRK